jgi:pimeloyl-ACP methyl ester carboxylesterase
LACEWHANGSSFTASPLALTFATTHNDLRLKNLIQISAALTLAFLTTSCAQAIPLQSLKTPRGPIQYTLHSPATPARHHVILAHGFLRSPQTMHHLAAAFASEGIETACIKLKRSTPFNGNHAENARDIIALREALGWKSVTYAGFSAGGLSALLAAAEDKTCTKLLLFDPVDQVTLGRNAARKIRIPTLAILGKPGPGNANRNATPMLERISDHRIHEIPEATHCDFEASPSALCHRLTDSLPDPARTAAVHEILLKESLSFLKTL